MDYIFEDKELFYMHLNIKNNFSKNVNMDPETGKESCVTHLFIDADKISENQITVKMVNFELNIDDFIDLLTGDPKAEIIADEKLSYNATSLFFNKPVTLTFTNIKGLEMCIIEEHKNKTFYGSSFRIKRGDKHFRICGNSQTPNVFVILDLVGNAEAEAILDFQKSDFIYKDINYDRRLLKGDVSLYQYRLEKIQIDHLEEFVKKYKPITSTRFDFHFTKEIFGFTDCAIKDEPL